MRSLLLLALLVSACVPVQGADQTPTTTPCPEPPLPPPPASLRAAAAFFEANAIARWADDHVEEPTLPVRSEVIEHLLAAIEALRAAEEAAAAARAYDVAETARMTGEDLLVRMIELGAELPPEVRQSLAAIEEGEPIMPFENPIAELPAVLEEIGMISSDVQEIAIQVTDLESLTAPDSVERSRASCLLARLEAFVDLEEIARMLEEDAVELRIEAQQGAEPEDRRELEELERQLVVAQAVLSGVRRGAVQTIEAVGPVFQLSSEASDSDELQDIGGDLIDACRAIAALERGRGN